MNFQIDNLLELSHCYAVASTRILGRDTWFFAPDDIGPCLAMDAETQTVQNVWDEPGGTMSIIPVPGSDCEILASQNFMPGFRANGARIVRARFENNRWNVHLWLELPYVHRFDIVTFKGHYWFIGCILSGTTEKSVDWTSPGRIIVAPLDHDLTPPRNFTTIADGMYRNHGYFHGNVCGQELILTACEKGVFRIHPSEKSDQWRVERLTQEPASDVTACDLDGDGRPELIVIAPFHGDRIIVYHGSDAGYVQTTEITHHSSFLHAIWSGELRKQPVALVGGRGGAKETLLVTCHDGAYHVDLIESGFGASNFFVDKDCILVANREAGVCTKYIVENE